jgi:predicted component of type VI protein secretion system
MNTLGADASLGKRVWRQNVRIKIIVNEVDWDIYETFNPHGSADGGPPASDSEASRPSSKSGENLLHLVRLCKAYVPVFTAIHFFIKIDQKCKKGVVLGQPHNLGFNTWIGARAIETEKPRRISFSDF